MKRFTIKDIAKLANVSNATVSRVINDYPFVANKTRKKIKEIISQIDYQPNAIARSLATKKTGMIGIIVWDLASPFFSEIVKEIGKECRKRKYQPIFCSTEGKEKIQEEYLNLLIQQNIEGLLIGTANLYDPQIENLISKGYPPLVLIDRVIQKDIASYVTVDNEKGAYLAVTHLIDHGHSKIACVTGPKNSSSGAERVKGYLKALSERNILVNDQLIISGNFLRTSGYEAAKKIYFLKKEQRPTAIFCSNDYMALGILEFFSQKGIKVPQDFALIGFDNISASSLNFIQLSTIDPEKNDIVKNAMNILIKKIMNPNDKNIYQKKIAPKLIVRKSCGCI